MLPDKPFQEAIGDSARAQPFVPELLAPAGDAEALDAAIANGADAVYFGLSDFNARYRATNFTLEELPRIMQRLHTHGVRGYVAFNTLIFSGELDKAAEYLARVVETGVDAVIVQDLGIARLLARMAPGLAVHGSTQMTLTEWRGVEFVRRLGIERVILARELSLAEIGRIRERTDLPLEVFVHGALCVAYSGQCLTSESFGGRSANRGKCAQACRQPYELIVDGQPRDLGDKAYLLSPQDLAAHDLIADLAKLGVASVKIEGRLKSAHYVAATTRAYRAALSAVAEQRTYAIDPEDDIALRQSFSRGFTHGFLDGVNHQDLVQGRFPKHRGVRLGTVLGVEGGETVLVTLDPDRAAAVRSTLAVPGDTAARWVDVVKPGDGLVFDEGHPEQDEQGGRVFTVRELPRGDRRLTGTTGVVLSLGLGRGDINPAAVAPGAIVWKTDDPALRKRLERLSNVERVAPSTPLRVELTGASDARLVCRFFDADGGSIEVESPEPLAAARKHPLSTALAREQMDRLGGTPFTLAEVVLRNLAGEVCDELPVMAPKSVLNELRRQGVDKLLARRRETGLGRAVDETALHTLRQTARYRQTNARGAHELFVLTRSIEQFTAALPWVTRRRQSTSAPQPATVAGLYCDFEDVRGYREAVTAGRQAGVAVGLATPRVVKPLETGLLRQVGVCEPDMVLVRNLAALEFFRGSTRPDGTPLRLRGDYSLNVVNELTADLLLGEGLESLTPGYDLNLEQLVSLLKGIDPGFCELVLHQHMPMFHMEHCVFSHVLSDGTDWHTCGRPCDRHRVELRDHVGEAHPLVADVGCRNTVFNARPQSAGRFLPKLIESGVTQYRVELLRETAAEVGPLLDSYFDLLCGRGTGPKLNRGLPVLDQLGVVGTLGFE